MNQIVAILCFKFKNWNEVGVCTKFPVDCWLLE